MYKYIYKKDRKGDRCRPHSNQNIYIYSGSENKKKIEIKAWVICSRFTNFYTLKFTYI